MHAHEVKLWDKNCELGLLNNVKGNGNSELRAAIYSPHVNISVLVQLSAGKLRKRRVQSHRST